MLNTTTQTLNQRAPARLGFNAPAFLSARLRRNQEPAASQSDMERGSATLPSSEVTQTLTQTWGWS